MRPGAATAAPSDVSIDLDDRPSVAPPDGGADAPDVVRVPLAHFAKYKWRGGWEQAYHIDADGCLHAQWRGTVKNRCRLHFRLRSGAFAARVDAWKPTPPQLQAVRF